MFNGLAKTCSLLVVWLFTCNNVECSTELSVEYDVSAINKKDAFLPCRISTSEKNLILKSVFWFKLTDHEKVMVYFYDPPTYDWPSDQYKGRAMLSSEDSPSLILKSVTLADAGNYECAVLLVKNETVVNDEPGALTFLNGLMKLSIYVPPESILLSTFYSANNLSLTCRSTKSKPQASISWVVYSPNGKQKIVPPSKIISEFNGQLVDTVGYLYWTIKAGENGTTFQCMVDHPDTNSVLQRNVTLVAPTLLHSVNMEFDWLGEVVRYGNHESNQPDPNSDKMYLPGLIKMIAAPGTTVLVNTSVVVTVSAEGAFPEPRYTWRLGDLTSTGKFLRIGHLKKTSVVYCLVDNPVGRAVMSIEIKASNTDPLDGTTDPRLDSDTPAIASGGVVAAIAFSAAVFIFLLAFLIYYFVFKRPSDKHNKNSSGVVEGSDDFVEKQKPLYAVSAPTNEKELETKQPEPMTRHPETAALLKGAPADSRTSINVKRPYDAESLRSSSTSTSGYSDRLNNGNLDESAPEGKERAITKHLQDFDENASFLGEYGSTFGLDNSGSPGLVELEARVSPFDQTHSAHDGYSDTSSVDSGASGTQGHYALNHDDSWEHIDPKRVVHTPV